MPLAFSRFLSLFESARQIESAVRAAAEFERARDDRDLSADDDHRASIGIPL